MRLRKQTKKWTMRDGKKIRICDMDTDHLKNTIAMLDKYGERKYQEDLQFFMTCPEPNGDMAMLDFNNAFDELPLSSSDDYVPEIYWNMMDDLDRREMEIRNG